MTPSPCIAILSSIHPSSLRYPSAGDWSILDNGTTRALCAAPEGIDPRSVKLVLIHELVESWLCSLHGVKESDVTNFDTSHLHFDEPGDSPEAPYYDQHRIAISVEKILCEAMGMTWDEHESNVALMADAVESALASKSSLRNPNQYP